MASRASRGRSKSWTPLTPEERKERQDRLLSTLADGVNALATSQGWLRYLRSMASLRTYSLNNQLLILQQRPDATRVAGYKTWQSLGRQVCRGAKCIWIFGYSQQLVPDETTTATAGPAPEPASDPATVRVRTWYPLVRVFDISDTEGPEIALPTPAARSVNDEQAAAAILQDVTDWLTATGWTVDLERLPGGVRGYTDHDRSRIALAHDADTPEAASVLLHETAHSVLHGPDSPYVNGAEYSSSRRHRGVAEIQAEAAAYVLADHLGLDTLRDTTGYVAGWATAAAASTEPAALEAAIRASAEAIRHAVTTVLDGLEAAATTTEHALAG